MTVYIADKKLFNKVYNPAPGMQFCLAGLVFYRDLDADNYEVMFVTPGTEKLLLPRLPFFSKK